MLKNTNLFPKEKLTEPKHCVTFCEQLCTFIYTKNTVYINLTTYLVKQRRLSKFQQCYFIGHIYTSLDSSQIFWAPILNIHHFCLEKK